MNKEERLAFIKTHPLFLGGLIGHIQFKLIMNPDEGSRYLEDAFNKYPEVDGYSALVMNLSDTEFSKIYTSIQEFNGMDRITPTDPLEIMDRLMRGHPNSPLNSILRLVYTKTSPSELTCSLN